MSLVAHDPTPSRSPSAVPARRVDALAEPEGEPHAMTWVLTLVASSPVKGMLRRALRPMASSSATIRVMAMESWKELARTLRARPVAIVVFDPTHPRFGKLDDALATIRAHPSTHFVLHCSDPTSLRLQSIVDLALAGVRSTLGRVDDRPSRIRRDLQEAVSEDANRLLLKEVERRLRSDAAVTLRFIMRHAPDAARLKDVAERVDVSTRTLERRARDAGLPNPARLLCWSHLYNACTILLRHGTLPKEAIRMTGFSSGSSFRRALKRETGLTTEDVRALEGQEELVREFLSVLRRACASAGEESGADAWVGEGGGSGSDSRERTA